MVFILGSFSIPKENWSGNLVGISRGIKVEISKKPLERELCESIFGAGIRRSCF